MPTSALRTCRAVVVVAFALLVTTAAPARAAVAPVLECVALNSDGSFTAVYGVDNDGEQVTIPIGKDTNGRLDNYFSPDADRGQPTTFAPGRSVGVVSADAPDGKPLRWHLGDGTVTANRNDRPCSDQPAVPDVPGVLLAGLAASLGAGWAFRRVDPSRS